MPSEWYYTVNGQQAPAPINDAQLKQMAASGQLQPTDMLWKDGMANWVPASSIKGLFAGRPGSGEVVAIEPAPGPARAAARRKPDPREEADEDAGEAGGGILGLHPLLVFVLSVCTFPIFGFIYIFLVAADYSRKQTRDADSAGRPLGPLRHPLAVLLLSYLTIGFYFCYWAYRAITDCAAYTGRKDVNARVELALMLVFPPYAVYVVAFRLPEMIRAAQVQAKQPEAGVLSVAPFFIVPCLAPGLPFVAMAYQDALNQVWVSSP